MKRVELPRRLAMQLLDHAQRSPDHEVCGLVVARNMQPVRSIPIQNCAKDTRRLFDMDDRELINAMKALRENDEELFAIYHSHPHAAPVPSIEDLERAGYPEKLHLIISLETKGVLQMRGWHYNGDTPEAVEVGVGEQ